MDLNFNWKFGDFEIRVNREQYSNDRHRFDNDSAIRRKCPIELIKWSEYNGKRSCYTVAYFFQCSEGYQFQSVGNRLFENIDENEISSIWRQLKAAQIMLDAYWKAIQYEEEY